MDHETPVLESTTISITVHHDWKRLYEEFWRPEAFLRWASGLSDASLQNIDGQWKANGPEGPITIDFTGHNDFGIMDHRVLLSEGQQVYVPLRVIENGEGAEVMLTLFRQPGMSDAKFTEDANWVRRDLERLKELNEH